MANILSRFMIPNSEDNFTVYTQESLINFSISLYKYNYEGNFI